MLIYRLLPEREEFIKQRSIANQAALHGVVRPDILEHGYDPHFFPFCCPNAPAGRVRHIFEENVGIGLFNQAGHFPVGQSVGDITFDDIAVFGFFSQYRNVGDAVDAHFIVSIFQIVGSDDPGDFMTCVQKSLENILHQVIKRTIGGV